MKLRKLHLQNYKVFDDAEFDFTDSEGKTLDTIVLAGANGCGKTTVLELLADIVSGSLNHIQFETDLSLECDFSPKEITTLKKYPGLALLMNNVKLNLSETIFFNRLDKFFYYIGTAVQEDLLKVIYLPIFNANRKEKNKILTILNLEKDKNEMERIATKAIQNEVFANKNTAPQATIERAIKEVNYILSDFNLSTKLVDIELERFVFQSLNGKKLYFEELSNGEKHLYFNAIYLHNLKLENCIILVDEPEIALHPSWQKAAVKFYEKIGKNNQVILATHSPHIMASVKPESLFVLHLDKEHNKVQILNMGKEGKHSKGLEPNRILTEIMEVETLREFETQQSINRLAQLLNIQQFESEEAQALLEKLQAQLGKQDSFIIRANHQMLMLNRQKEKQNALHS